jgi:hypothetical protein
MVAVAENSAPVLRTTAGHNRGAVVTGEHDMPAPRPIFGPTTLKVSETKSDLLQMIERAQLEILYRHPSAN